MFLFMLCSIHRPSMSNMNTESLTIRQLCIFSELCSERHKTKVQESWGI